MAQAKEARSLLIFHQPTGPIGSATLPASQDGNTRNALVMKEIIFGFDCVNAALSAHRRQIYKLLLYQSDLVENSKTQSVLEAAVKGKFPYNTRLERSLIIY